jgi:trehalose synthase
MDILKDYQEIVGREAFCRLQEKAERLSSKHVVCCNSTYQGGGVAEILDSAIILLNELGVEVGWRILHGSPDFFSVTKQLHNALQGDNIDLTEQKKELYVEENRRFSIYTHIENADIVMIHDPQPLPLIDFYDKKQPWIFTCHLDLTTPNPEVWQYLRQFIVKYNHLIVSLEEYRQDLPMQQSVVYPAIDPLSTKNKDISEIDIENSMQKYDIDRSRPVIAQISRFDKWKDPIGVLDVFHMVREKIDCQLVLLGSLATDDPDGQKLFKKVEDKSKKSPYEQDIKILLDGNNLFVNCLQRASSVILQKSIREGFGLTVSEALYKGTPVVASNVGGIPTQVIDGSNGFLYDPKDYKGFSEGIIKLIKNPGLRDEMGKKGQEYVRNNFLITRLISDWLTIFENLL